MSRFGAIESRGRESRYPTKRKDPYEVSDRAKKHGYGLSRGDEKIIRTIQNGRSIITGEPIYDFHHEPPVAEILKARIKIGGGGIEIAVGVSNVVHALLHHVSYQITGDFGHLNEVTGILCRYDTDAATEQAALYFERLLSGPELREATNFVLQRRKKYRLPC